MRAESPPPDAEERIAQFRRSLRPFNNPPERTPAARTLHVTRADTHQQVDPRQITPLADILRSLEGGDQNRHRQNAPSQHTRHQLSRAVAPADPVMAVFQHETRQVADDIHLTPEQFEAQLASPPADIYNHIRPGGSVTRNGQTNHLPALGPFPARTVQIFPGLPPVELESFVFQTPSQAPSGEGQTQSTESATSDAPTQAIDAASRPNGGPDPSAAGSGSPSGPWDDVD